MHCHLNALILLIGWLTSDNTCTSWDDSSFLGCVSFCASRIKSFVHKGFILPNHQLTHLVDATSSPLSAWQHQFNQPDDSRKPTSTASVSLTNKLFSLLLSRLRQRIICLPLALTGWFVVHHHFHGCGHRVGRVLFRFHCNSSDFILFVPSTATATNNDKHMIRLTLQKTTAEARGSLASNYYHYNMFRLLLLAALCFLSLALRLFVFTCRTDNNTVLPE